MYYKALVTGLLVALGFGISHGVSISGQTNSTAAPVEATNGFVLAVTRDTKPIIVEALPPKSSDPVSEERVFQDPSSQESGEKDKDLLFDEGVESEEVESQPIRFRPPQEDSELAHGTTGVSSLAEKGEGEEKASSSENAPKTSHSSSPVQAFSLGELLLGKKKPKTRTIQPFRAFNRECNRGWPGDGDGYQVVAHKRDYDFKQAVVSSDSVLAYEICPYCLFSISSIRIVSRVKDSNQEDTILECVGSPYAAGVVESALTVNNCHEYNNVCNGCSPVIFIYPSGGEKSVWLGLTATEYFDNSDSVMFYVDGVVARTINLITMDSYETEEEPGEY